MKFSHTVMLVLAMGMGASAAMGDEQKTVPTWGAGMERDAKAGKLPEGVLKLSMENVRRIQQALVAKSHAIKDLDGTLNKDTLAALKKLQTMNHFKETGTLTLETLHALGFDLAVMVAADLRGTDFVRDEMTRATGETRPVKAGKPIDVSENGTGEREPLGYVVLGKEQIEELQKRLKKENYFSGEANGDLSAELIVGVRTFQKAKAHNTKSFIDIRTLAMIPEVEIEIQTTEKLDPAGSRIDPDAPPRKS